MIGIADSTGNTVARYEYDAWGVCTTTQNNSADIAGVNPFRYRGYYYDVGTGLYYLQSRYYDATVGRFVNGDEVLFLDIDGPFLSFNLFTYCKNKLVFSIDLFGFFAIEIAGVVFSAGEFLFLIFGLAYLLIPGFRREVTKLIIQAVDIIISSMKNLVEALISLAKKARIPNSLKKNGKVKTPDNAPDEYQKQKGGQTYTHKKTKWTATKSHDNHYNGSPHWHVTPDGKNGNYYNVTPEGDILG